HPPTLPCRSPPHECRIVRSCSSKTCTFHTNNGARSAALSGQAAQGYGDPQGEAVPPDRRRVLGELSDAAQPVADGVGVDEQQPRGALEGRALLQVGGQG